MAINLDPQEANYPYFMGYITYFDNTQPIKDAMKWFDEAIKINTNHQWSLLYKAHCLADLEQWNAATEFYNSVSPSFFTGYKTWRYIDLLELRAYCYYKDDKLTIAHDEVESIITRLENNLELTENLWGWHIIEMVKYQFHDLFERLHNIFRKVDDQFFIEKLFTDDKKENKRNPDYLQSTAIFNYTY